MRCRAILLLIIVTSIPTVSADESWITYTSSIDTRDMRIRDGYLWCATRGGVTRWNMSDMTYEKFTTMDGLSTNDISSIAIDNGGRVWVLPRPYGGVNMYDGATWTTYSAEDGLSDMNCWTVATDNNGDVWVHTPSGIYRFDGVRWKLYTSADGLPALDPQNKQLYPGVDGNILLYGVEGIFSYDGNSWSNILSADRLPGDYILSIAVEDNGAVWCATHTAVIRYDGESQTVFSREDGIQEGIKTLFIDDRGIVWIGNQSYDEEVGLVRYDGTQWETFTREDGLASNRVYGLRIDENGILWIGTGEGISRFDGDTFETYTPSNEIADNWLRSVTKHGEETWAGSSKGVSRFDGVVWTTYNEEDNLPDESVHSVIVDGGGTVWAATARGLSRYDGVSWETVLESDCRCLATGIDSDVWVGTNGDGVYRLRENEQTQFENVKNLEIICIEVSGDGTVWIGTTESGVFRYQDSDWTNYTKKDGLKANYIWSLEAGKNDGVWAGQYLEGVSYFDGQVWHDDNLMKDDSVFCIVTDRNSRLWFGSYQGITLYDGESLVSADREQGLEANHVRSIVIDDEDVLWAGTSYGLSTIRVSDIVMEPTAVEKTKETPEDFALTGIYPNPFNLSTTISFDIDTPGYYTISIFNITGQKVSGLLSENMSSGACRLTWDGTDGNGAPVSTGIYFIRILSGNHAAVGKALLLK